MLICFQIGTHTRNVQQPQYICGQGPTVYERITAYYDWIIDNTKDATYCKNPFWNTIKKKNNKTQSMNTITTEKETPEQNQKSNANIIFKFKYFVRFYFIYLKVIVWLL